VKLRQQRILSGKEFTEGHCDCEAHQSFAIFLLFCFRLIPLEELLDARTPRSGVNIDGVIVCVFDDEAQADEIVWVIILTIIPAPDYTLDLFGIGSVLECWTNYIRCLSPRRERESDTEPLRRIVA